MAFVSTMQDDVETRVRALVSERCKRDVMHAPLDARWRDLDIDSLDLLDVIVECEQVFAIVIPDSRAVLFYTLGDVIAYITEAQNARKDFA